MELQMTTAIRNGLTKNEFQPTFLTGPSTKPVRSKSSTVLLSALGSAILLGVGVALYYYMYQNKTTSYMSVTPLQPQRPLASAAPKFASKPVVSDREPAVELPDPVEDVGDKKFLRLEDLQTLLSK